MKQMNTIMRTKVPKGRFDSWKKFADLPNEIRAGLATLGVFGVIVPIILVILFFPFEITIGILLLCLLGVGIFGVYNAFLKTYENEDKED